MSSSSSSSPPIPTFTPEEIEAAKRMPEFDPDYQPTYLRQWNNSLNPDHVSCATAVDIVVYCYSPANQARAIYNTGTLNPCFKQVNDLMTCLKVIPMKHTDPEGARRILKEARDGPFDAATLPHVWPVRTKAPTDIFPKPTVDPSQQPIFDR